MCTNQTHTAIIDLYKTIFPESKSTAVQTLAIEGIEPGKIMACALIRIQVHWLVRYNQVQQESSIRV